MVLGGGLAGLSYVHYLRNFAAAMNKGSLISKITILEANNYIGGSVKTKVFEDGVIHELGPRSIRTAGVRANNTITLLEQLGLAEDFVPINNNADGRWIYNDGRVHSVPLTLSKIFYKIPASKSTIASAVWNDIYKAEKMNLDEYPDRDPSLYDFMKHRFGVEVAEKMVDPILRGITAGDARDLSTRALLADLLDKEQVYGSIVKGIFKPPVTKMPHDDLFPHDIMESKLLDKVTKMKAPSFNLKDGLQTLPDRLSDSLLNTNEDGRISIYNQTKVESIKFNTGINSDEAPCSVVVSTLDGDRVAIDADHIISTITAKDLAKTLPDSMDADQRKALDDIVKIPHSPVGCVSVEYRDLKDRKKMHKCIDSFGFLTQSKAGSKILGISMDTTMFPQRDKPLGAFRMTAMIGGSWFKEVLGTDNVNDVTNAQLEQIALDEIRKILNIEQEPHRMETLLWKTGIAQYKPGHVARLTRARAQIDKLSMPLTLLGQSYDGVAVNDVIFTARMAAFNYIKSL